MIEKKFTELLNTSLLLEEIFEETEKHEVLNASLFFFLLSLCQSFFVLTFLFFEAGFVFCFPLSC